MRPDRRDFLKSAAAAGAAVLLGTEAIGADQAQPEKIPAKFHGVNLGGWLVLEKWITPSVYAGTDAPDEYTLCETLGKAEASARLMRHRQTWITADDFAWLADRGINAVRLPVGYGVLEENSPFITAADTLDWAFRTAKAHGLRVLLDLHGVPGSQNGWDHSGRQGALGWHTSKTNIDHSLAIVEELAAYCKWYDNLLGFELLNEPRREVPLEIIKSYYQDAYQRVRKHIPPERTSVVIHDAFRPLQWAHFMQPPRYANVVLDTHLYQCFTEEDRRRDMRGQIELAGDGRRKRLAEMQQQLPCIVAEWSCALPPQSAQGLTGAALDTQMRAFGDAQLSSYDTTRGWFFWTCKTERSPGWSYRECVKRGWLPEKIPPQIDTRGEVRHR